MTTTPSDKSGSLVGIQIVQVMGASDTSQPTNTERLRDGVPRLTRFGKCHTISQEREQVSEPEESEARRRFPTPVVASVGAL